MAIFSWKIQRKFRFLHTKLLQVVHFVFCWIKCNLENCKNSPRTWIQRHTLFLNTDDEGVSRPEKSVKIRINLSLFTHDIGRFSQPKIDLLETNLLLRYDLWYKIRITAIYNDIYNSPLFLFSLSLSLIVLYLWLISIDTLKFFDELNARFYG